VLVTGSVVGILANPLAGRVSDRMTWRADMRRPWLLIGGALSLAGAVIIGPAGNAGLIVLGWILTQVGVNGMMAVLVALLPDHVPGHRRGMVSGLLGVGQASAAMIGTALAYGLSRQSLALALIAPAVIAMVFTILACLVLKDRRLTRAERPPFDLKEVLASFWVNPRRHPDFAWAWVSRFAIFMAISMVLNYQLYFLESEHAGSAAPKTPGAASSPVSRAPANRLDLYAARPPHGTARASRCSSSTARCSAPGAVARAGRPAARGGELVAPGRQFPSTSPAITLRVRISAVCDGSLTPELHLSAGKV
jgi:MFS family permease